MVFALSTTDLLQVADNHIKLHAPHLAMSEN
jgi:hypothetical protein